VKDGPLRRGVKRLARANYGLNALVYRAVRRWRGEAPYLLGGDCRRCARCCEAPAVQVSRAVWYLPTLRQAFLAWQRHVNGFELVGRDVAHRTFVFRCTHFDRGTRSCDSYDSRPGMCRDYPRALLYQPNPEMLPGCGYRPLARNAARLRTALAPLPLTAEQREKLEEGLHLRK
jgi:Fe-S-cluster containining protein